MNRQRGIIFTLIFLLISFLFVIDLLWGSIPISLPKALNAIKSPSENSSIYYILMNFRLPKAITSLVVGAGISIAGLMMQSLFRNPLADTSILGISGGAGLGVAIYMMIFSVFPALLPYIGSSQWGLIISAFVGAISVLLIISLVSVWIKNIVAILIIGVMVGYISGSLISVLKFFTDNDTLRGFMVWSFGSVSSTTWEQLQFMIPIVFVGLLFSLMMPKYMNAFYLGDNYTTSMGISVMKVRASLIVITSIITASITAFCGPIAFLGIAVPHFARVAFSTSDNRILIPATICCGAALMLICDILTQVPGHGFVLPINAITSLIGAPVVIWFIINNMRKKTI